MVLGVVNKTLALEKYQSTKNTDVVIVAFTRHTFSGFSKRTYTTINTAYFKFT